MKKILSFIVLLVIVCTANAQKGFFMLTKQPPPPIVTANWNFSLSALAVAGWNNVFYSSGNPTTDDLTKTDLATSWALTIHHSNWRLLFGSYYASNTDGGSETVDSIYGSEFPPGVVAGTFINGDFYFTQMTDGLYPVSFDNLPTGTYQLDIMCSEKLSVMGGPASADCHVKFGSGVDNSYTSGNFPSGTSPILWPFGSNTNKVLRFVGNITSGQSLRFGIFQVQGVTSFAVTNAVTLTKLM